MLEEALYQLRLARVLSEIEAVGGSPVVVSDACGEHIDASAVPPGYAAFDGHFPSELIVIRYTGPATSADSRGYINLHREEDYQETYGRPMELYRIQPIPVRSSDVNEVSS